MDVCLDRTVPTSQQAASIFLRCLWALTIQMKRARETVTDASCPHFSEV